MKVWLITAVAILLPGGCLIALAIYLRRRWLAQAATYAETLIRPLGAEHYRFVDADDRLRIAAERRRDHANAKRLEAAQIASGKPPDERLRIVRGR